MPLHVQLGAWRRTAFALAQTTKSRANVRALGEGKSSSDA